MLLPPTDPEKPKTLAHIWRKLYVLRYMQKPPDQWSEDTEQQHMDIGYCLDRYSLIDASIRKSN